MQKSLIATACLFALLWTNAHAQTQQPRRDGGRMTADSARQMRGQFRDMQQVTPSDLPASLTAYVQKTYPSAELRRTAKDKDGKYYVVLIDASKARKLLVANSNGDVLETRDMPAGNRGGRGRRGDGQSESN